MMYDALLSFDGLYTLLVMPFLIFIARVVDVSLGTVRVIFVSRGLKYLAPVVGFFEILIWLLAMGQIMKNLSSPACYVAYAGGFAMGNYVGIAIAEKLSLGVVLIRVVTKRNALPLVERLQEDGYGVTSVDGHGSRGQVKVVFTVVARRQVSDVVHLIRTFNPHAFYSIEEVDYVEKGIFPLRQSGWGSRVLRLFRPFRKGK